MACLMVTFFFEEPLVPCIFVSSTKNLGRHTRRASSLLISAVAGGTMFPPTQGAIVDAHCTRSRLRCVYPRLHIQFLACSYGTRMEPASATG
ncbi:hypothetical protein BDV93DRAFT_498690 [Ceratobasidium sp. AG-I]|nr:hypothetical protein BDV93DRAFT_498690 [Ceratobasidium sp. AG-I]